MTTNMTEKNRPFFRKVEKKEPGWLFNKRKSDWEVYADSESPNRAIHLWRYTDPENFLFNYPVDEANTTPPLPDTNKLEKNLLKAEYAGYGYNRPDLMTFAIQNPELLESGIIFKDLYSAVIENENLVEEYLGRLVGGDFGKFEALNSALWNSGLFLYIPDNTVVEKPIQLQRNPSGMATFLRLLVVVGKNSELTLVDDYSGKNSEKNGMLNSVVEIFAGESSRVRYANLQRLPVDSKNYITHRTRAGRDANVFSVFGALGGAVSKVNTGTVLAGQGAESKISGVVFGGENQHFDYHTRHEHAAGESFSNIDFKVILKDSATSAYTGLIKIDEHALNCEAYQLNRNLMLNKGPKSESIPELEILNDQVRCSHGATMGPIDPEMLFYLKSRGVNHDEAVKIIVSGFIDPMINEIPESLQPVMKEMVLSKLEG